MQGIPIFLIFASKHRLYVLTIYVLSKNKKNIENVLLKIFIFYKLKNLCILHRQVFEMFSNADTARSSHILDQHHNSSIQSYDSACSSF